MNKDMTEKAVRRIKKLGERELVDWAENAAAGMLRYIELYRNKRDEAALAELSMHMGTVTLVIDELILRKEAEIEDA